MENCKKALLFAPMTSVHKRFNNPNIKVLTELGYEVHLVSNFNEGTGTESGNEEYRKQCQEKEIITHSIPFCRAVDFKNISTIHKLRKLINNDFDIIHAHTETGGLLFRVAMMFNRKKYRAFYTPHGMSFYRGSSLVSQLCYRPMEKWICSKMDINIAMNDEEAEVLGKWNKSTLAFVHGVGVDMSRFNNISENIREELGISKSTTVITAVGELNENKNHRIIIKALGELKDKDFCFIICGVGELKDELLTLAKESEIFDKIKLLGYRNDIPSILKASDIFVFPSYHEGLPVSVMEAMASSLPVLCSDIRGSRDLIDSEKGGYLYNPNDIDGFKIGIETLIENGELRKKMGEYNKKKADIYSVESIEKELRGIYQ